MKAAELTSESGASGDALRASGGRRKEEGEHSPPTL